MRSLQIADRSYVIILEEFEQYLKAQGYSQGSVQQMPSTVREFLHRMEAIGLYRLDWIGPKEIQSHYEYLRKRPNTRLSGGLSSRMIAHHMLAIRTFFNWLMHLEALDVDPMIGLNFARPTSRQRVALTELEMKSMFSASTSLTDKALLYFYYGCGLRRQEGVSLDLKDVDLTNGHLVVRKGKFSKRREVPLTPRMVSALKDYLNQERRSLLATENETAFLINNNGNRMDGGTANKRIQAIGKRAAVSGELNLHRLRHSIATHMKERGMAMHSIQQFLGHGSLDVTQAYIAGYDLPWKQIKYPKRNDIRRISTEEVSAGIGEPLYKSTWRIHKTHWRGRGSESSL